MNEQSFLQHGSLDGHGPGADHDQPYDFGRRPQTDTPFPFSTRQYARLLGMRGEVRSGATTDDNEMVLSKLPIYIGTSIQNLPIS